MTTKEQERKALQQIEKIVANLGEGSYIATAFDGCFEIAKENIDNDFACSMKQRAESAEAKIESYEITINDLRNQIERLQAAREVENQKAAEANSAMQDRISKLRKKTFDTNHYKQLWNLVYNSIENNKAWMDTYADTMADLASTPADISFVRAVANFKKCRADYEEQKKLLDYLDTINPEED